MEENREKIIGIIGGMGPEATIDLFRKIIQSDPARIDQDHLRIIIDCNSKIPDRVSAIFENTESPLEALIATARNLEWAGADFLLIACNTAHYYIPQIRPHISIPILSMIEETAAFCDRSYPGLKRFGLLAQSPTLRLGLYAKAFSGFGKQILSPHPEDQERVMRCIYEIKAGNAGKSIKDELVRISSALKTAGAEAIVLGCTEIPLILKEGDLDLPCIDATQVLAGASVARARGR